MIRNQKGFTLVELLAVIVVLAIIIIIAMPNVISAMNSAKLSTFKVYAKRVIQSAQGQYQTDNLTSFGGPLANAKIKNTSDGTYCYDLAAIGLKSAGSYKGYVIVTGHPQNPEFTLYLRDNSYMTVAGGVKLDIADADASYIATTTSFKDDCAAATYTKTP